MKNNIDKLFAKEKKITIGKKEKITLTLQPLGIDDMDVFNGFDPNKSFFEQKEVIYKLLARMLGCKESEAKKISIEYIEEIMKAFCEINGYDIENSDPKTKKAKELWGDKFQPVTKKQLEELNVKN